MSKKKKQSGLRLTVRNSDLFIESLKMWLAIAENPFDGDGVGMQERFFMVQNYLYGVLMTFLPCTSEDGGWDCLADTAEFIIEGLANEGFRAEKVDNKTVVLEWKEADTDKRKSKEGRPKKK